MCWATQRGDLLRSGLPMYKPFPVYSVEGDAYDCGVQYGEQAAERVARSVEIYLSVFGRQVKLPLGELRARARAFAAQIEALDAATRTSIRGRSRP